MKHIFSTSIILTLLSLPLSPDVLAQPPVTNQVLTLQVLEFNKLAIVSLTTLVGTIENETVHLRGLEAHAAVKLAWTSNGEEQKITVACVHLMPGTILRIHVREWKGSREVVYSSIELSDASTYDLLRGLSRSAGGCELRYSMRADERMENGEQVVIYTVTSG